MKFSDPNLGEFSETRHHQVRLYSPLECELLLSAATGSPEAADHPYRASLRNWYAAPLLLHVGHLARTAREDSPVTASITTRRLGVVATNLEAWFLAPDQDELDDAPRDFLEINETAGVAMAITTRNYRQRLAYYSRTTGNPFERFRFTRR